MSDDRRIHYHVTLFNSGTRPIAIMNGRVHGKFRKEDVNDPDFEIDSYEYSGITGGTFPLKLEPGDARQIELELAVDGTIVGSPLPWYSGTLSFDLDTSAGPSRPSCEFHFDKDTMAAATSYDWSLEAG